MKVSVWTSHNPFGATYEEVQPRCIFIGDVPHLPAVGDYMVLRDGFASERVKSVTHNFADSSVEITIAGIDRYNEYGPCLVRGAP